MSEFGITNIIDVLSLGQRLTLTNGEDITPIYPDGKSQSGLYKVTAKGDGIDRAATAYATGSLFTGLIWGAAVSVVWCRLLGHGSVPSVCDCTSRSVRESTCRLTRSNVRNRSRREHGETSPHPPARS